MIKRANILIAGPLPPPAGGISIHIWRLKHLLEDEFTVDFIDESGIKKPGIFSVKSYNPFAYLKKISRADILYIQSGSRILKKLHILSGKIFGKKMIITLHGYGPKRRQPFRALDNFFFNLSDKIILVNPDIANRLSLSPEKCVVKHAFLPPVMNEETELPSYVSEWVKAAKELKEVVICANASRLDMFKGQELYGIDMCIDVLKRLRDKGIAVSFVYTVSSLENCADRFEIHQQRITTLGLKEHFLFINEKLSFVKLVEQCDIVVRPTNTDGDALTIREAIYLHKPVLASDVTERPAGTTLFKTRNMDDFEQQLLRLINGIIPDVKYNPQEMPAEDNFKQFYSNLINSVLKPTAVALPKTGKTINTL